MKERRIQKSRENNPLWSGNKNKRKNENTNKEVPAKRVKVRKLNVPNEKPYVGTTSKLGQDKLRSNFNLKSQAELHTRTVKKQKKLSKTIKQLDIVKKEKTKKKQDNMPVRYILILYIYISYISYNSDIFHCILYLILIFQNLIIELLNLFLRFFFYNISNFIFFYR